MHMNVESLCCMPETIMYVNYFSIKKKKNISGLWPWFLEQRFKNLWNFLSNRSVFIMLMDDSRWTLDSFRTGLVPRRTCPTFREGKGAGDSIQSCGPQLNQPCLGNEILIKTLHPKAQQFLGWWTHWWPGGWPTLTGWGEGSEAQHPRQFQPSSYAYP